MTGLSGTKDCVERDTSTPSFTSQTAIFLSTFQSRPRVAASPNFSVLVAMVDFTDEAGRRLRSGRAT